MSGFKGYKRTIQLDFDYDSVKKGVPKVNQQMALLNAEYKRTSEQVKLTGNSFDKMSIQSEKLSIQLKLQGDKVNILKTQLETLNTAENKNEKAIANKTIELKNAEAQYVKIQNQIEIVNTELNKQKEVLGLTSDQWKKVSEKSEAMGRSLSLYVTAPIVAAGAASFSLASDMNEILSKTGEVFDESAGHMEKWAETSLESMGIAKATALDTASGFGALADSMGIMLRDNVDMSKSLTQLSADLASFYNTSQSVASTALKGIFTGETEALKQYGIVMTEVNLKEYALSNGIKKKYDEMTQAEKVQLRYNYIMDVTKTAQGDFARTSDSASNQAKIFKESLKELGETFGQEVLPLVTPVITFINECIQKVANLSDGTKALIVGVAAFTAVVGPVLLVISKVAGAISSVNTTITALSNISNTFNAFAGNAVYMTFTKWALVIIGVVAAITALVVAINFLIGRGKEMNQTVSQITSAMNNTQSTMQANVQRANSAGMASKGYATGTNFVKESGFYRVNEYGEEEIYLERGSRVRTAEQTRKESSSDVDMSETNSLLRQLIERVNHTEKAIANMPYKQKQLGIIG